MPTNLTDTELLASYIPETYLPDLKENMRDATMLTRITNRDFDGQFKNKGDTVIVRKTPTPTTKDFVDDQDLEYEKLNADDEKFTINRAKYWAFSVPDIRQALSDIPKFAERWTREGGLQFAHDWEVEAFADLATKPHAKNKGNGAGLLSGIYNLGDAADTTAANAGNHGPLYIYKTDSEAAAKMSGSNYKAASAVDMIAAACGCLDEQPSGIKANPWIIVPSAVSARLQTSELSDASKTGDSQSIIRKDVGAIGNILGMDVFRSNLLPTCTYDGRKCFVCLFGDSSAVTFCNEISKIEMFRSERTFAYLHRSLSVADWFVRWPERLGAMVVTLG